MTPDNLEGWTPEVLTTLVRLGVFESDRFDFKETLPHSKDDDGKARLRKAVVGFANTDGGFLVFGVRDDRSLQADERIVGVDPSEDYPARFSSLVENLEPTVPWTFKNPPIQLKEGRVVHVFQVQASALKPHGFVRDDAWVFTKRTNGGTLHMTYEEVRSGFQNRRQRQNVLLALRNEVSRIEEKAKHVNIQSWHNQIRTSC